MFGALFNNVQIQRTIANNATQLIKVPLTYSGKDKMVVRLTEDPEIDKQTALQLPIMSFEMGDPVYATDRKIGTMNKLTYVDPNNPTPQSMKKQFTPVPYDFNFQLHIYVKNIEDGTKIVETILPFFTPAYTQNVLLVPEMNDYRQIPIVLTSVHKDDNNDSNFDDRRILVWTLDFVLQGYVYGPVVSQGVIKFIDINFRIPSPSESANLYADVGHTPMSEEIVIQPGLTANGQPTTNANNSIAVSLININDDYGFVTTIVEGTP